MHGWMDGLFLSVCVSISFCLSHNISLFRHNCKARRSRTFCEAAIARARTTVTTTITTTVITTTTTT